MFITLGYAAEGGQSIPAQLGDFVQHYPDVLMSIVGFGLFVAVAATSVRAARRRLSREAWYALHLYAYLAVALSFAHQLAVGTRLHGRRARAGLVERPLRRRVRRHPALARRDGRSVFNLRHRLWVHARATRG